MCVCVLMMTILVRRERMMMECAGIKGDDGSWQRVFCYLVITCGIMLTRVNWGGTRIQCEILYRQLYTCGDLTWGIANVNYAGYCSIRVILVRPFRRFIQQPGYFK